MNLLGIDLKPLLTEITKFSQGQQQIITLLQELLASQVNNGQHLAQNNQLQKLILRQLGGKVE